MLKSATPSLRILIAEDNALIGMLLADMLAIMGHDVCAIEMTEAGTVTRAAQDRPDLLIVDGWLGEGSGIAAVATILRTRPIPHLFVTGDPVFIRARVPDAVLLIKPFLESALSQAIGRAMQMPAAPMAAGAV